MVCQAAWPACSIGTFLNTCISTWPTAAVQVLLCGVLKLCTQPLGLGAGSHLTVASVCVAQRTAAAEPAAGVTCSGLIHACPLCLGVLQRTITPCT